jgi:Cys-tRNA(Pro)/Cys-tRNA(Cys) deacylase
MSKTTRATQALASLGVKFALHAYDYDPGADRIGLQAAEALGIEPRRVLKTLMAEVDGKPVCVVVPSDRESACGLDPSSLSSWTPFVFFVLGRQST